MKIQYSKKFLSGFQRLENKDKVLVIDTIDLFCEDPQNVALHNHPLRKPMYSQRAISASNNLRLVFREKWNYAEVLFIDIGDHERVYQ